MNYFEYITLNKIGESKKYLNTNITINNPVLYIFIGKGQNNHKTFEIIKNFYDKKIQDNKIISYVSVSEENITSLQSTSCNEVIKYEKSNILDFKNKCILLLNKIQNEFLEFKYNNPVCRRVYIIFNTNEKLDISITDMTLIIKEFFVNMNNAPLIDIYAITDERNINNNDNCKQISDSYLQLKQMNSNNTTNMNYIISNFDSNMTISDLYYQYESIALCSLLKDCSSSYETYLNTYREQEFIQNSIQNNNRGCFYTIGRKKIEKPEDILKMVVLKEIISDKNKNFSYDIKELSEKFNFIKYIFNEEIEKIFDIVSSKYIKHVSSLSLNAKRQFELFTKNGDALNALFGVNENSSKNYVDFFYEQNIVKEIEVALKSTETKMDTLFYEHILDSFESKHEGFYITKKLLNYLKENMFREIEKDLKSKVMDSEKVISFWLNDQIKENTTKPLGIFSKVYKFPFSLAKNYLNLKNQYVKAIKSLEIFEQLNKKLDDFISKSNYICEEINYSISYFDSFIQNNLRKNPKIITENFEQYYTNKTEEYIKNNFEHFNTNIYSCFYKIGWENINLLFEKCNEYAIEILKTTVFSEKIYSEIYDRVSKSQNTQFDSIEKITELLYQEINKEKIYFSNIMFLQNLFQNTCFITADTNIIKNFSIDNSNLNMFFDTTNKGLDIIYLIGAFSLEQLFYAEKYGFVNTLDI